MSVQVQWRRGAATNIAAFAPAQGEIVVDETNNRAVVGDGSTPGGWPAAKLSEVVLNNATSNVVALGPKGSAITIEIAEQLVSGLTGTSVTASAQIPAGVLVFGCSARVTTTITGAASWAVGYTGSTSAFGSGLGASAGSTNEGMIGPNPFYSATNIILTATGGGFTGGAVRLSLMYLTFTPPTS